MNIVDRGRIGNRTYTISTGEVAPNRFRVLTVWDDTQTVALDREYDGDFSIILAVEQGLAALADSVY